MEINCHNRSFDRYIKVKKGNFLLYRLVKVSAIPCRSRDDRSYRNIGVNVTFGLLDCDRQIGDIVIPRIVKPGFCSIHYTATLAGLQNVNRYIGNIVLSKVIISGFHCITIEYSCQFCSERKLQTAVAREHDTEVVALILDSCLVHGFFRFLGLQEDLRLLLRGLIILVSVQIGKKWQAGV